MKKTLIVLMIFSILSINIWPNVNAAVVDYDHNELLDYPGYAEAMYESIVEQTTFISGRYTENKEYVNQSINQVTDYAKGWWDEYMRISDLPPKEKIREMINASGGYLLTVGDFIKNLFTDAEKSDSLNPKTIRDGILCKNPNAQHLIFPCDENYNIYFSWNSYEGFKTHEAPSATIYVGGGTGYTSLDINSRTIDIRSSATWQQVSLYSNSLILEHDVSKFTPLLSLFDVSWSLIRKSDKQIVQPSSGRFTPLRNHVVNNNPTLVTPQPKAYLSCPDGTRINMSINGGTFLDVNGQVMQVSKDGTATVSSQICNLGWEKPTIKYIDDTDQIGITTPDGKIIDAETGETITGEFDDELEDGCGTLCAIGKMLKGLGEVAKSIAGLATKILDGLIGLFVPDNLDFVQEKFNETKAKFEEKFAILDTLMDVFGGLSAHESENILMNYSFSLPITGDKEYKLFEFEAINNFIPYMKRFVSGILIMYTLLFVYRKIVGTGGVMEK